MPLSTDFTDLSDFSKLDVPAKVTLFILDLNPINVGEVHYYTPDVGLDGAPVVYLGITYLPWPVKITGLEKSGTGTSPRPIVEVSNYLGAITELCQEHQDMVGASVTRRTTLSTYLLANTAQYQDETYLIERKAEETAETVKFELASPMDFLDKQLPGLLALASGCPFQYKSTNNGSGCGWLGTDSSKWFDRVGTPVLSIGLDDCGKHLSDCKLRFGANNPLDYGGNPGLGRSSS